MVRQDRPRKRVKSAWPAAAGAPLLSAKLCRPPLRPGLVARPRLLARLDQLAQGKLALICAPAGYGKTTLLADWARRCPWPVAWLSLDRDDDLGRFLAYVVAAWETVQPGVREGPLGTLAGSLMPPTDRLLSILLNEAAARKEPFVLALDDYHVVEQSAIHEALTFMVDHLPPPLHLVVVSRTDPPLPLARWRARGELVELRADDLRFATAEAVAFLTSAPGVSLSPADAVALAARTEGWVAALQLVALSRRGRGAPGAVEVVSGKDRHIADYLAGEVLSQQPEPVRAFLLRTAILERLSGPLCAAVTGQSDSRQILEALEAANLFIVPLDDERRWYRYHQLFAEFLRHHLERTSAGAVPELHRRASAWYAENGLPDEAFRHAVAGQDWERAALVVEDNFPFKLGYGEYKVVGEWFQSLPAALFTVRPLLGLYRSVFLMLAGQPGAGLKCLEEVERQVGVASTEPAAEVRAQRARIAGTRAILACFQNDLEAAVRLVGQALRDLPDDDLFYRFGVNIALGDTYRRGSLWALAVEPYAAALKIARRSPVPFIAIHPLSALGDLYVMRGHLRRAAELRQEALHLIADRDNRIGISLPLMGWAYIRMGELLYEWNHLEAALSHLWQGLELAELGSDTRALVFGYLAVGQVKLAQGDVEGAGEQLRRAQPLVEAAEMPEWTNQLQQLQVQLWLAQGDLRAAGDWVEETRFGVDDEASYSYEVARLALARVLIAQGEHEAPTRLAVDRALVLLNRLLGSAEAAGRMGVVVEVLALQALAYRTRGETTPALVALERALRLAEPEGYVRLFANLGPSLATLLQEARSRGLSPAYVGTLLAAFGTDRPARAPTGGPLAEPLSGRELEVLRLLVAGLSNRAIASELVIADGTAKRHIATIYEKLGVNSRTQAVARARELGLLQ